VRAAGWLPHVLVLVRADQAVAASQVAARHVASLEMAAMLFAVGLDPDIATIFVQSHVPEHSILGWMMECTVSFGELSRMAVVDAGCALGLSRTTATRVLEQLCRQLPTLTANLVARTAAENMTLVAARPALAPTLGGEMRCLRALQHAVVLEMVRRLGGG
jgi:hypothetical protein